MADQCGKVCCMSLGITALSRRFGSVVALDGVSLRVARGELLALPGPSGSGKSTLLRILGGLDFPHAGQVLLDGHDIAYLPARARRVGFVFQSYALFRHMTAAQNIAFGLSVRPRATRPSRRQIATRVEELLTLVQLEGLAGRFPDQLSGGQRQRVALARALAIEPELLLLDEPFGALDAKVRKTLRRWFGDLHDRTGVTTILVTHDQEEAMELADRVAVLNRGRLEQVDTPERLYAEPATPFVHQFMGESLQLPCEVRDGVAHFDQLKLQPVAVDAGDGTAVAYARPHDVHVSGCHPSSAPNGSSSSSSSGSIDVYARFEGYVPRPSGSASFIAGPKVAHFDRVEWRNLPDASTAAAALQTGEIDWWEQPPSDLVPALARNRQLKLEVIETAGFVGFLRFNHLHPPFDNPAIRRAVLLAINQADFMQAVAGSDRQMWRDDVGFFAPGGVMHSDEGMEALKTRSVERARAALQAAGYKGEKVTHLYATDLPPVTAMGLIAADVMRQIGLSVDVVSSDWGSVLRRINNAEPPERGGWNSSCSFTAATSQLNPAAHNFIRGTGRRAGYGWPTSPDLERLRDEWLFEAKDDAARARIGRAMQRQAFIDVPYVPLGLWYQNTACRANLSGMLKGLPLFWNLRRT
jgi:sulfate ABC transporter ATP-binding protein